MNWAKLIRQGMMIITPLAPTLTLAHPSLIFNKTFHVNAYQRRLNVQFQKISISTPWKVNGNSKGVGDLKSQSFLKKSMELNWNFQRGGGGGGGGRDSNPKTFCGRGMDIFWNNTMKKG